MTRSVGQEHAATVNDKGNVRDNTRQHQIIDGRTTVILINVGISEPKNKIALGLPGVASRPRPTSCQKWPCQSVFRAIRCND